MARVGCCASDTKSTDWKTAMITSKIAQNGRTTIPRPVRAVLRLRAGDEIAYAIEEWTSDNDRAAYAKL
jgi:hypothetical protein